MCFGRGVEKQLGYDDVSDRGKEQGTANSISNLPFLQFHSNFGTANAIEISLGDAHACVLFQNYLVWK